ncbi:MAG: sigma factor [Planctomycetota bacterium]
MTFPTTIWTTIHKAGADDPEALQRFAERYRQPVLRFIQRKGFPSHDAEDICQDVFLRLFSGRTLTRADAKKGRFRSLMLAVATHVIQDRLRKRPVITSDKLEPAERDEEFDQEWILALAERALVLLREQGSRYYAVMRGHLEGKPQDRNKLWIARKKLTALIRHEVAFTCGTHEEFEEEITYLSRYLRPDKRTVTLEKK